MCRNKKNTQLRNKSIPQMQSSTFVVWIEMSNKTKGNIYKVVNYCQGYQIMFYCIFFQFSGIFTKTKDVNESCHSSTDLHKV